MKVNAKIKYGLQTMVDIALHQNDEGVLQKEISHRQDISNKYLDQIISALKKAGLIRTIRGRKSGYILTRIPEHISIYEIYKAFEGDLNIGERRVSATVQHSAANRSAAEYWDELNKEIAKKLQKDTLNTICEKQARYDSLSDENMYFI